MIHDVVIVGGGPAGLAAAIALGERDLSVAIAEPRTDGDKVCGEGIMPSGVAALEQLGVLSLLEESTALAGIRFIVPGGSSAAARFREGPGLVVRRPELARVLRARLEHVAGVRLVAGRATDFERGARAVRVRVGDTVLQCRLLIGADGLSSTVRRWAGLELDARGQRWGARQHFEARPWTDHVEVHFEDGLEAYVSSSSPERVGVTILWHRRRSHLRGGADLVKRAIDLFPVLARRLGAARACTPQLAVGPLERRTRGDSADGVLLLGDAAGYLDAITGEGISLALCSAIASAQPLARALQRARELDRIVSAEELDAAGERHRVLRRRNRLVTRALLALSERPAALSRVVSSFAAEPAVFQHFLSANMGLASPFRLPLGGAIKLLFGLGRSVPSATDRHLRTE